MAQALIYSCLHCRAGVQPGGLVCYSPVCIRKENKRQTDLKCKELGIGMQQLFLFRMFSPGSSP